jgi:hypothetical protein
MLLRYLPLIVGLLGGSLLMLNRILTASVSPEQARSDALGLGMSAVLILVAILYQQAQPRDPETVPLEGPEGIETSPITPEIKEELIWLANTVLQRTKTRTLLLWWEGQVLLRAGVLSKEPVVPGPIFNRVLAQKKPVYLVSLKLFPGQVEFSYLPQPLQALVCQPCGEKGIFIFASDTPRIYSPEDLAWIEIVLSRTAKILNTL